LFNAASASAVFDELLTAASSVLTDNIALVFGIVGALIGLGVVVRLVKRHIGRKA
jgi:hypothetical protein